MENEDKLAKLEKLRKLKELRDLKAKRDAELNAPKTEDGRRMETLLAAANQEANAKDAANPDKRFSYSNMVYNTPGSVANIAKGLYNVVAHPIDTGEGLYNVGAGLVQKAIPGEQGKEQYADPLIEGLKQYTSKQGIKNKLENDPAGFLLDASLAGGLASKLARVPGKAAAAIDPVNIAKNLPQKAISKMVPDEFAKTQMQSAIKFNTTTPRAVRDKVTQTMLDEKIMPTAKGMDKARDIVNGINTKIDDIIAEATDSGAKVKRAAIYDKMKQVRREFGGAKLEAPKDLKKIDKYIKNFELHLKDINKEYLTPAELQALKKDAYKKVFKDKAQLKSVDSVDATRLNIALSAKEKLEQINPNIKPLNAREGDLLDVLKLVEQKSNRIENLNNVPITGLVNPAVGAAVGGPTGGAVGGVATLMDMPKIKARAAILANTLKKRGAGQMSRNNVNQTLARQLLLESSLNNDDLRE